MTRHLIEATTHGVYLESTRGESSPAGVLVGFHGQGETAAIQMAHMEAIRGGRPWHLVSVQGLNRYYTRKGDVVAAWMTRDDREMAIADNIAYVRAVVSEVKARFADAPPRLVYCGFSQGTAMAYRAAAFAGHACHGLVILAGDLSPDVQSHAASLPPILLGRGTLEEWYTAERARADLDHLRGAGIRVAEHVFDGGHERHASFTTRAGAFLDELAAKPAAGRRGNDR
ncbi:MAG: alpha/beta hydrolase [Vicinamibacterales bacterium]